VLFLVLRFSWHPCQSLVDFDFGQFFRSKFSCIRIDGRALFNIGASKSVSCQRWDWVFSMPISDKVGGVGGCIVQPPSGPILASFIPLSFPQHLPGSERK